MTEKAQVADAILKQLDSAQRRFEDKQMRLRRIPSDIAVSGLLHRATRTAISTVAVAQMGEGSEAIGLCRFLVETLLVVRWLTNQQAEERSSRFIKFESKQGYRMNEVINKLRIEEGKEPLPVDLECIEIAREYKDWRNWSETGLAKMSQEQELLDPEEESGKYFAADYDVYYFFCSCYIHPTARGIEKWAAHPEAIFTFTRSAENESFENKMAFRALFLVSGLIRSLFRRASLYWGLGLEEELCSDWNELVRPYLESVQH